MSDSMRPHRRQSTRLCRPWDPLGKNTGVGCHFLLQCMKVKSESEVAQSCPTLSDLMDCSPPGSSIHWIFQARVLEWVAIAFSLDKAKNSQRFLFKNNKIKHTYRNRIKCKTDKNVHPNELLQSDCLFNYRLGQETECCQHLREVP